MITFPYQFPYRLINTTMHTICGLNPGAYIILGMQNISETISFYKTYADDAYDRILSGELMATDEDGSVIPPHKASIAFINTRSSITTYNEKQHTYLNLDNTTSLTSIIRFSAQETISNIDQYLLTSTTSDPTKSDAIVRSGGLNGLKSKTPVSPYHVPTKGTITKLAYIIQGMGSSSPSVVYPFKLAFQLWNVGYQTEGTKIADIDIMVTEEMNIPIGYYKAIDSNLNGFMRLNIPLNINDMLGIKFTPVICDSCASIIRNVFFTFTMEK